MNAIFKGPRLIEMYIGLRHIGNLNRAPNGEWNTDRQLAGFCGRRPEALHSDAETAQTLVWGMLPKAAS